MSELVEAAWRGAGPWTQPCWPALMTHAWGCKEGACCRFLNTCSPVHPSCWREGCCKSGCPAPALPTWVRVLGSFWLCACRQLTLSAGPPDRRCLAALNVWRGAAWLCPNRLGRACRGARGQILAEPRSACRLVCGPHSGCPALTQHWCRGTPRCIAWLCPLSMVRNRVECGASFGPAQRHLRGVSICSRCAGSEGCV